MKRTPTGKKKDSTVNERMRQYRKSTVTVTVSKEAGERLDRFATEHGMNRRGMLERLIMQGVVEKFSGAAKARELLAEFGGDGKAAMRAFTEELKQKFPGYKADSKLAAHAEARRRYSAVSNAISRELKRAGMKEGGG